MFQSSMLNPNLNQCTQPSSPLKIIKMFWNLKNKKRLIYCPIVAEDNINDHIKLSNKYQSLKAADMD